jgi:hypothetical protein
MTCYLGMLIRFDDGALRILATDLDPEILRPKRAYRGNRHFARNELFAALP